MKSSSLALAALLLLGADLSFAVENKADTQHEAATVASPKKPVSETGSKHKSAVKLVDINSASKAELKKLPGISDAEADKIIAGRPFGSKSWLVTNNLIPLTTFQAIKQKIVCKLTQADIDKIMAAAKKK